MFSRRGVHRRFFAEAPAVQHASFKARNNTMRQHVPSKPSTFLQTLVFLGGVVLALGLAAGAVDIPSDAGYAGVGPNFLPWLVSGALLLCGLVMVYKART